MNSQTIDEIKTRGQIDALSRAIDARIFAITNRIFGGLKKDGAFDELHKKLEAVRFLCDGIDELLVAVTELDGKST